MESSVLSYLGDITVRSLFLAALALAAIAILRVRAAAARHAVGTMVVAGMCLLAALAPWAPPVPLRVLRGAPASDPALPNVVRVTHHVAETAAAPAVPGTRWQWPSWPQTAAALYFLMTAIFLARLATGYAFTRRLVRNSRRTELGPDPIYESAWITVPLTVGTLRPKILLPENWREWHADKLAAVLAHERTHVRRADWGIGLMAGVNRCVFWFHPLAWWLERRMAALAEQACDDAALLEMGAREPYAQALLDMAAAVHSGRGRLVWEAMAMAKASEVHMRIERILDETRKIPGGVNRRRWAVLLACSLPLIYAAAVVQLVPAQAQEQRRTPPAVSVASAYDAGRLEQQVALNPDDLESRSKLIGYYFVNNIREPRLTHILWLVEHHPEADLTGFNSAGISPRANSLNTVADYERVASMWRQQVAAHPQDHRVLANAAQFFGQPGGDFAEAERLLQQARTLPSTQAAPNTATNKLANLYIRILNNPAEDSSFAAKVQAQLENSTDGGLLVQVASGLNQERNVALANRLRARSGQYGGARFGPSALNGPISSSPTAVARLNRLTTEASAPPPTPAPMRLAAPPLVLTKVDPAYPPLAMQAKVSGIVRLGVTIGPDGHVANLAVMAGHPLLIQSTLEAVKGWTFAPVLQNGVPVAASFQLEVPFQLDPNAPFPPARPMTTTPPPPMPTRIRVGGNVQSHMLVRSVDPVYPEQARTAGPNGGPLEGTVKLNVVIGNDGQVQSVQPVEGHPLLAVAAEEAVKQWIYKPTLLNGNPVEVTTTVDVEVTAK